MGSYSFPARRGLVTTCLVALVAGGAVAVGGCGSGGSGSSSAGPAPGGTQPANLAAAVNSGRITVAGTGTVTGTPNQLLLSMGVQVNGASVGSALASANDAVSRVTAALRGDGVAAAAIQTSGLAIWPNYANGSQVPQGYGASESIAVTLSNLKDAGTQINDAVHAGGNATTVSGVSLNLTDDSGLLAAARSRAVTDAETKAAQYAKALGQPLGPVVSITDQPASQPVLPFAAASSAAKGSVPVSPGTQQVSVSVTVVFAV
jgi:uncharacterized protein YggE